jgi:hypothetical protein
MQARDQAQFAVASQRMPVQERTLRSGRTDRVRECSERTCNPAWHEC